MNNKIKRRIRVGIVVIILILTTFLCGYFAPSYLLEDIKTIIMILLTIFGVALTIFIFLQNVVQNVKNNIFGLKKTKEYKIDKFKKLDSIVNELMGDIKWLIIAIVAYIILILFFMQISNNVFQIILQYIQYLIFSIIALAILDLILATFSLIKICSNINLTSLADEPTENTTIQNELKQ
ncbi:MAG: hypothetical protein NC037_00150 [Bacteroides sp.]|nr:hypothetical protein [Bacteroides sp.]